MIFSLPAPGVQAVLIAVVLLAGIYDVRTRRIPNWICLSGIVLGIALNAFVYRGLPGLILALEGLGLGFGVYFILYALHAMGGGDVKLMAAVGSLVGWRDWLGIFFITALVGGVLALIVVLLRGRFGKTVANVGFILGEMMHGRAAHVSREELDVKNPQSVGLPHGAVVAVGTLFFLASSAYLAR
jgi:prepilin peptidase CpaA